jgi:hypothetical protein
MRHVRFLSLVVAGMASLLAIAPAGIAAPGVSLLLNGKPVSAIPVDQLTSLTVTIQANGSFKSTFGGQWAGSIDQAINVVAKPFYRTASAPDLETSNTWAGFALGQTSSDTAWAGKSAVSMSMNKVAREVNLFKADSTQNVLFTARFRRQVYTGKLVWSNGGWVKETRWETVGPALGQTVLRLDPPTFAKSLKLDDIAAKVNIGKQKADMLAHTLLQPEDYGGQTVTHNGSKLLGLELQPGKQAAYSWNYEGDQQLVYAHFPANLKFHAAKQVKKDAFPVPFSTEADFNCPVDISAKYYLSKGQWEVSDLDINEDFRTKARTLDGKTADQVIGSSSGPTDTNASPQDQAKQLLKGFGF